MLKNYLKITFRNILKKKAFFSINIIGFAFSISICMMITLFILNEYSYDLCYTNAANIYKMVDNEDNSSSIDYRVKEVILDNYPEVKNGCLIQIIPRPVGANYKNNTCFIDNIMSVDNAFFEMFSIPFIYGNSSKPFQDINSVILTESSARSLFGNDNPLGKEIVIMQKFHVIVAGIIRDFPQNSSINANVIVNSENNNFKFRFDCQDSRDKSTYRYPFKIYLHLGENIDTKQFTLKMNSHPEILFPYVKKISLLPLKEMYLNDNTTDSDTKRGNPVLLRLMTAIASIILILAIINYINLTVAQQNKKNKETGIRKTIGAERKDMIFLFLTESLSITIISFIISLIIVDLGLSLFNNIVNSSINVHPLIQFPLNIILLLSVFLIGVFSGIGPAFILSSFNPVRAIRGNLITMGRKNNLRKLLTVFQFTMSITLIFCIIVIQNQITFVKHKDLGFDKEQLLYLELPPMAGSNNGSKFSTLQDKLIHYPAIKSLSATGGVPGEINFRMGAAIEGKNKSISIIAADSAFLNTFNIQLIKGRRLLPGDIGNVCMINETAYKYFEWDNLEDKRYNNGKEGGFEVIGVVKDFHYASLHEAIEPLCILFSPNYSPNCLNIRITNGEIGKTIGYIQKVWKEFIPDYPIKYKFYNDWFDAMYRQEEKFAELIGVFALLAISISCMGILGLAIFSSESRTKEIGIRKVIGANVLELMFMLNKDFLKWVSVAFVIACPIAWYAMNKWLQDFAYRTEIDWWLFALSGFIALFIALLTVSWQTWKAATANPVDALKYE